MSCIVTIPFILPAAAAAWPVLATAAAAAAGVMGFAAVASAEELAEGIDVDLSSENAEAVAGDLGLGEDLVFAREDVQIIFSRDTNGKTSLRVHGTGKSKTELKAIGEKFSQTLIQQYVYNRMMTELQTRDMNVVDQEIEEDGTVRLHVRTYQG